MARVFGANVTIEGFDELQAALDSMATDGAKKAISRGLRKAAAIVQKAIQQRAPVRTEKAGPTALPPGALAADIRVGNVRLLEGSQAAYGINIGPGAETQHVARWVEYGHDIVTRGSKRKGGTKTGEVPAHPFIRPAFEESQAAATEALETSIQEDVNKALQDRVA